MAVEYLSLDTFLSTEASNVWLFLPILGGFYCRFLIMSWLPLFPVVGGTNIHSIRTGLLSRGGLTKTSPLCGVVPSLPVLFTCPVVWIMCALLRTPSVMNLFVVGVMSAWGVPTNLSGIRGSIFVVMIRRVRLLNNFCCKFLLLVSVTFPFFPSLVWVSTFGSLSGSHFASFSSDS